MEETIVKGLVEVIWKGLCADSLYKKKRLADSSRRRAGKDLIFNYYTAAEK